MENLKYKLEEILCGMLVCIFIFINTIYGNKNTIKIVELLNRNYDRKVW